MSRFDSRVDLPIMLRIEVKKLEMSGWICSNPNCKHLPEYHHKFFTHVFHIKQDTICAFISLSSGHVVEIYCTDCIDEVYQLCKLKLNKALWAFH